MEARWIRVRRTQSEGGSAALRDQITAERAPLPGQVTAERERAEAAWAEAAWAELAEWTADGPLVRAGRASLNRQPQA